MQGYTLRPIERNHLEIIFQWRNSERIRKNMFNDQIILWEDHLNWFNRIKDDTKVDYQMFFVNNIPRGLVSFIDINQIDGTCFWGIYIGDAHAPKGSGTILGKLGIDYAIDHLKIRKINAEVLSFNERSINLHLRLGFIQEGIFKKHVKRGNSYVDVIRYAYFSPVLND